MLFHVLSLVGSTGENYCRNSRRSQRKTLQRYYSSAMNRIEGEPVVTWTIFDVVSNKKYSDRIKEAYAVDGPDLYPSNRKSK